VIRGKFFSSIPSKKPAPGFALSILIFIQRPLKNKKKGSGENWDFPSFGSLPFSFANGVVGMPQFIFIETH